MEAPEKLYLPKRNKLPLEVVRGGEWYETNPQCMYGSVEYIRRDIVDGMLATAEDHAYFAGSESQRVKLEKIKDNFIEKACDAYCKVCKMPNCRSSECRLISDFKGHLENI